MYIPVKSQDFLFWVVKWPNSLIPQRACSISHNAIFRTERCTFFVMNSALWDTEQVDYGSCEIVLLLSKMPEGSTSYLSRRNHTLNSFRLGMHICVSELTIIASDNGLSPGRRQAIIWTKYEIVLIGPLETTFNEIFSEIHTFFFNMWKKMHLKMSSGKWRPFCLGLNVLS